MSRIEKYLKNDLDELEGKGLKRRLRQLRSSQGPLITIDSAQLLNFCSNNYLGLADDPRLKDAAIDAIKEEGFGSGASRLVCGNMRLSCKIRIDPIDRLWQI